jgi:hypothetical protein
LSKNRNKEFSVAQSLVPKNNTTNKPEIQAGSGSAAYRAHNGSSEAQWKGIKRRYHRMRVSFIWDLVNDPFFF